MPNKLSAKKGASEDGLSVLLSHFQPLKTPTRLQKLGKKLLKSRSGPKYENMHFSHVEDVFSTKSEAESHVQHLVPQSLAAIGLCDIHDPSGKRVAKGYQFATERGLQSYWIETKLVTKNNVGDTFGLKIERRIDDQQKTPWDSPDQESPGQQVERDYEFEDDRENVGLIDGRIIDRENERIVKNIEEQTGI